MKPSLRRQSDHWLGHFDAMACDCQLLMRTDNHALAQRLLEAAVNRTAAIEAKYSRYRRDNLCHRINHSQGQPVAIDAETHRLLSFADTCYRLSDGLFDLTAGALNQLWRFDGTGQVPEQQAIDAMLTRVGWDKVQWNPDWIILPEGMALDFGGIGKEYAVDCVAALMAQLAPQVGVLVNFGGDLALSGPAQPPWQVGITPSEPEQNHTLTRIPLSNGALATSGDTQRCLNHQGVRYSHLLNPKTGWATQGGPRQLTVAGATCLQAGLLSSLALLHGADAEAFIQAQGVRYWVTP
ncbi:FAD:protein FMN transferase [Ferrimonas balearica]|uniref:FAD:protein FMN transferase n=1 Tax=Ferrimonas balearica TaxID=44012 RepID=UPI001FEE7B84|nr:FAD:protein FMN transferase [Ferrimonas balearica]